MKRKLLWPVCVLVALAAGGTQAQTSANYPVRPVRMIVPFAPGGASDFVGRILQPKLSEELGQQIVIDNRAGAAGDRQTHACGGDQGDGRSVGKRAPGVGRCGCDYQQVAGRLWTLHANANGVLGEIG